MAKKSNSMKRRNNGRYQMKRAMHKGRIKANYKRQAKNNPNYDRDNAIWEQICVIFLSVVGLLYMYLMTCQ